jgi:hypothetical protein
MDRESDSELDAMLDSDYFPSCSDDDSDDEESDLEDYKPKQTIGTIYAITSTGTDKVYIGSTKNPNARWTKHKNQFKNGTLECMSKLVMKYGNATFTELAQIKYTNYIELVTMERIIIKQYGSKCVNKSGTIFSKEVGDSKSPEYIKAANNHHSKIHNQKHWYCDCCKKEMFKRNMYSHIKTNKHIKNIKNSK